MAPNQNNSLASPSAPQGQQSPLNQKHQSILFARQSPVRGVDRKADLNAAVARMGEEMTGTSLLETHRPKYNPAT